MDKLPTNFFVGIVAGLTGAGIMWLCVRNWNERAAVGAAPESTKTAPPNRIGMAEHYRQDPELEKARRGARRVDPKMLDTLAGQPAAAEAQPDRDESPASNYAPDRTAVMASFRRPESPAADPLAVRGGTPASFTGKANSEGIDNALGAALEAAQPYVKSGFTLREEHWGGVMGDSAKAIRHRLFKGNEYWFWAGTDFANSGIDVHVYDSEGNLAESEHWQRKGVAAARVTAAQTGTYYLIISDQRTSDARPARAVHWAVAYGFR